MVHMAVLPGPTLPQQSHDPGSPTNPLSCRNRRKAILVRMAEKMELQPNRIGEF